MSKGSYTFLPWVRQGLANRITAADPAPAGTLRASIEVKIELDARLLDGSHVPAEIKRDVQLYGPGEVIGLQSRAVVRTEPRDWITNFEPNYLAAVDFYDEDLPWRYTPAAPDGGGRRLRPWITLIVLAEDEFAPAGSAREGGLPLIAIPVAQHAALLPRADDLWAWAHVHVNRSLGANPAEIVSSDTAAVAGRLGAVLAESADLAYSRLVCPRKLEPNKAYHAFVIPTFEAGRLAGMKLDPALASSATASAWAAYANRPDADRFPVYYRWFFRTGAIGDFEYLVRLLQPKPVDRRVGVRDMDVQRPGSNLPGIVDPALHGALKLGGALRVPRSSLSPDELRAVERDESWAQPYPHPFQRQLASFINLNDDYASMPAAAANVATGLPGVGSDPDPVITSPLYGRWHALTSRLLYGRDKSPLPDAANWVHELNLDPRFRVPAGFGTLVVQDKQEDLMASAWDQVGDVLEANRRIRRLQLAQQTSLVWHRVHLQPFVERSPTHALALTAPLHGRALASTGVTLRTRVAASAVPPSLLSSPMRRMLRPRGPLMRALAFGPLAPRGDLIERVNSGELAPVPPKTTPAGVVTVRDLAAGALPGATPRWLMELLRRAPWLPYLIVLLALGIALVLFFLLAAVAVAAAVVLAGLALAAWLVRTRGQIARSDALTEEGQTPAATAGLPASPDFAVTAPSSGPGAGVTLSAGGTDSAEAVRFKTALTNLHALLEATRTADRVGENGPPRPRLDLAAEAAGVVRALDPAVTITRRASANIDIPARIRAERPDPLTEAWAYPVFDIPMYRPLADLSGDLLVPNVNLIETNSVTLLETNQKFIEAYMVGLNHEFARELLWREYPTDQRGSSFRQFWDVSAFLAAAGSDVEALREKLRDIPPIHRWPRSSALGAHDARERPGDNEEEVVLVIRGELLKRYPNAVIYAQRAEWARTAGKIDPSVERHLIEIGEAEEADPPRSKLRTPLYEAKIEPDIYFFGFDLTVPEARGGSGDGPDDPAGWFFVLKERPGEPRFGFDEKSADPLVVWNDLGWDRVPMAGAFVRPASPNIAIPGGSPPDQQEKEPQRLDDAKVAWDATVSAAELAYILYQAPVMVAIHAAEMLPNA